MELSWGRVQLGAAQSSPLSCRFKSSTSGWTAGVCRAEELAKPAFLPPLPTFQVHVVLTLSNSQKTVSPLPCTVELQGGGVRTNGSIDFDGSLAGAAQGSDSEQMMRSDQTTVGSPPPNAADNASLGLPSGTTFPYLSAVSKFKLRF